MAYSLQTHSSLGFLRRLYLAVSETGGGKWTWVWKHVYAPGQEWRGLSEVFAGYTSEGLCKEWRIWLQCFVPALRCASAFGCSNKKLSANYRQASDPLTIGALATNTGNIAGEEMVKISLEPAKPEFLPKLELASLKRVHQEPGERLNVQFALVARTSSQVDSRGLREVSPGGYALSFGGSQPTPDQPHLQFNLEGRQEHMH